MDFYFLIVTLKFVARVNIFLANLNISFTVNNGFLLLKALVKFLSGFLFDWPSQCLKDIMVAQTAVDAMLTRSREDRLVEDCTFSGRRWEKEKANPV